MIEQVTVAVDGSAAGDAALRWTYDRGAAEHLEQAIVTVVASDTNDVLEASTGADLLVIGSSRPSPVAGLVHGTHAMRIAAQSPCITVVVPSDWQPVEGHVVVGWTQDATAEEALAFAAREAHARRRALTIVHTFSGTPSTEPENQAPEAGEVPAAHHRAAEAAVRRIAGQYPRLEVHQVVQEGSAAVAIVRAASGASLVVVGCRGRGPVAGYFLGSVSRDVLLNLPAPVAVIPKSTE